MKEVPKKITPYQIPIAKFKKGNSHKENKLPQSIPLSTDLNKTNGFKRFKKPKKKLSSQITEPKILKVQRRKLIKENSISISI